MNRLILLTALAAASSFGQLHVLRSGGFSAPYDVLLPEFEGSTGIKVTSSRGPSQGTTPNTIAAQLRGGLAADMVIMSKEGMGDLIKEGRIVPGSVTDLATTPLGLAVRAGAPKPDISTVAGFKKTVLRARSINSVSTSEIYLKSDLFPRLGIAKEMSGILNNKGLAAVVSGETEMAILPVSEILHVAGIDFVGTLPMELQHTSVFSAALVMGAKQTNAAKRLIAFLTSDTARGVIRKSGMEPVMAK